MRRPFFAVIVICLSSTLAFAEEKSESRYKAAEEALDRGNRRVTDPQIHELDEMRLRDADETPLEKINRDIDRREIIEKQKAAAEREAEKDRDLRSDAIGPTLISPERSALASAIMMAVHERQRDTYLAQEELNREGNLEKFEHRRRQIDETFQKRLEELLGRYDINMRPTTIPSTQPDDSRR